MQQSPSRTRRDWLSGLIILVMALSLGAGLLLRLYKSDWDKGHAYLFHPDERAIVYSAVGHLSLDWPPNLGKLLSPDSSLNPHFFAYGSLPMYLTRLSAHILSFFIKNAWANEMLWLSGRSLSALFDIATLLAVFLLARRLYGRRVGVLAVLFGSFAVLNIQLSHFLTVDTFLPTFIVLGMYFALDIVRRGSLRASVLTGMALGIAMATKVSVAPLLASVFVAWALWAWRGSTLPAIRRRELHLPLSWSDRIAKSVLGLLLAVIFAGVCFILAEPYAIIDWTSFARSINEQSRMVRGIADFPYTRQYLDTPPVLYQVWNTAVWGLGAPLGMLAYAGLALFMVRALVRRTSEEVVLLSWVLLYFLITGFFQVKFLRYMLPLFPFLFLFAADLFWRLWDRAAGIANERWPRNPLRPSVASAAPKEKEDEYLQYDDESEQWQREHGSTDKPQTPPGPAHTPAAPRLPARSAPSHRKGRQISLAPGKIALEKAAQADAPLPPPVEERVSEVIEQAAVQAEPAPQAAAVAAPPAEPDVAPEATPAPLVAPASADEAEFSEPAPPALPPFSLGLVRETVRSWTRAQQALAVGLGMVIFCTVFYAVAFARIYAGPHPWVTISQWIYRNAPIGSTHAIEHWDDALPLGMRLDGQGRNFEQYKHVEMKNYEDDNPAKLEMFVANLQQADYIILASNRLYGSTARLPDRYPMTQRYYQLLFGEQLGFKLVATAQLYPNLFGVCFVNDTLTDPALPVPELLKQQKPCAFPIHMGKADESFSVYDHPMPLVFQKVEQKSEAELRGLFAESLQTALRVQQERAAQQQQKTAQTRVAKTFLLDESERKANEEGGTYLSLFNPNSLANRLPVLVWWLAVQAIFLAALPIGFVVFRQLSDRGYALIKTLSLLLVAYLPWLLGSFHVLGFGRLSILAGMAAVGLVSALLLRSRRDEMGGWLSAHRWLVVTNEIVFALAFLAFVYIRMLNPDLWQPWNGGEKPMEFAFLSAIAKTTYFPPYDPFFAGGYINYYYYGQYICAMLVRLTGITPGVGFNLIIPLLFALTVSNSFSITYNLVAALKRRLPALRDGPGVSAASFLASHRSLLAWALAGALFVTVIGNLATIGEVMKGPYNRGQTTVKSNIPGLVTMLRTADGLLKALRGERVFEAFNYWNPSRVIPDTINEFPYWSYLFADLHPHTIGIPFTLLVLGLSLGLLKQARPRPMPLPAGAPEDMLTPADEAQPVQTNRVLAWLQELFSGVQPADVLDTLILGLAVGALGVINTWDLPTYLGVLLAAIVLRPIVHGGGIDLLEIAARFGSVVVLSVLFYVPFYQNYQALASGIGLVRERTGLGYYLAVAGFFVFIIVSYFVADFAAQRRSPARRLLGAFWRHFNDAPLVWQRVQRFTRPAPTFQLGLFTALALALLCLALAVSGQWILVLLAPLVLGAVLLALAGPRNPERMFLYLLAFAGLLVSLGIEVFFLRDWLQGGQAYRMNTLFKFGIQVWVLLALAAAAGLALVTERFPLREAVGRRAGRLLWYAALAIGVLIVALFPIIGTRARVADRFPGARPPIGTLDGLAFMEVGTYSFDWERKNYQVELAYDYDAIRWLQNNVQGSPVIAEAVLPYYRELGARVSAFTGLPTLVGNQHEQEQRPGDTQVGPRENDARTLYTEASFERVIPLLNRLWVRYIYVGQLERSLYPASGLAKFDQAVGTYLDLVYENPRVKIYKVKDLGGF